MVASKTKKTSKYTYAERVLSAFSQAQKEHRRHSVHLATLRAHVRKTAKDRKDKLGPQWASWVGKAVKRLEEQGVLQPVDSSGYVGMTPEGKKVLSYARRKLLPTAAGEVSHAQEDAVWKNVTEHFSPSGHKRQRARSVSRLRSAVAEEEIEEEDSASVRGSPRSKRQRRAQSPVKSPERPLSKMTKTELQTKIRELQRAKFTDQQLKADLADREGQLRKVQDELKQLKFSAQRARAVMHEEELTELDEYEFQDQMDQEFPVPEIASFDVHTPRAGTPAGQGAGLPRTQSGSIIHDISMRPTPAPSSPGAEHDKRYQGGDDVFADQQLEHPRTPESLPGRIIETDEQQNLIIADRATGFQTLKDLVSRVQNENENYKSRVIGLEGETQRLQIILNELETRKQDLQQCLADRDNKIMELRSTVLENEQATVDLNETIDRKEASLSALSTEVEMLLCSKNEFIVRVQGMEEELAAARTENRRLTEELVSSHRAAETLQERMAELIRTTEERQGELAQALSVAQSEAGHGAVLAQELLVMNESTQELEKQLSNARNTVTVLGTELGETVERNSQLELTLDGSRKEVEELKGKIMSTKQREVELTSKLLAADATRQSLDETITSMKNESRAEQVKAQTTILGLLEKIDGLQTLRDNEAEAESFRGRIGALEGVIEGLRLIIQNANDGQKTALAAFNSCKEELGHAQSALTAEQTTCDVLRVALTEAQEQVSRLMLAKAADESTIATLRAAYEKWKKMQTECLSEMESTVCYLVIHPLYMRY
ncbi:hypothetical protein K503DRAFT_311745 [Rhizopogon vinicolor AM-OR11-026]|uniref:Uncharacterized protein n=1 Tax=Rhizopogon vinicolor AM-OR11-026 TaxID=1314800 RepID=A0A1B7MUP6_9AGAM|nr:hypothetical protein K503DRAFT_311745 [Rhizopogon vinicolor AM-OR11-026]